jgi:hypothetical protein
MNILFHKMRTGKKGQIIAVLTLALIIFIIAAFLVVNLGKTRIQDNKVKNAAQSGVLAGGSSACIMLNSMANINDNMVLNFAGFTLMMQFLLVSWIIDYVKLLITAYSTLIVYNVVECVNTLLGVATLCLTTSTIALMIMGATKVGNSIKKMIDEINDKLPKNSRDSARQYAFSNIGVDEPKVPFSKSGCSDAWCYSLIETEFDEFMRLLPAKNKADMNYGTSTIDFDWNDSRTKHIVNTKIEVTVTPVQKVPFRLIKFGDVPGESGAIISYLNQQDLGMLGPIIIWGVTTAGLIIAMIYSTVVALAALAVVLGTIAAELFTLAAEYYELAVETAIEAASCCWSVGYASCLTNCWMWALVPIYISMGAYYTYAGGMMTAAAIVAGVAAVAFLAIYSSNPPEEIPCFVWEQRTEHPISATVTRTTSPSSINYGIYTTDWPVSKQSASGVVKDGTIFPPNQNFDIIPNF